MNVENEREEMMLSRPEYVTKVSADRAFDLINEHTQALQDVPDFVFDLTVVSVPNEADFKLYITNHSSPDYRTYTDDVVQNVYRGLYTLVVEKEGFESVVRRLDTILDLREKLICSLYPVNRSDESNCKLTDPEEEHE